ncbi:retron St85 family effector protein [Orbus wheelerorum]|uniref:retron St85 family effector protein n=1 Tax=Orbus wheelerorum TaxID=3074111 RepID=UPI00370D3F1F
MQKELSEDEKTGIANIIYNYVFKNRGYIQRGRGVRNSVFLCGGDIKNESCFRYKLKQLFSSYLRYELMYPETIFDDLLSGQTRFSLLEMENILAASVDAIVIIPESPGSFAELGAFSNNPLLSNKMVVLSHNKYKKNKSFINYGPLRLVKSSTKKTGKVIYFDDSDFQSKEMANNLYKKINDAIGKIRKFNPVEKDLSNILETEYFVLPCIYLFDNLKKKALIELLQNILMQNKKLCEIAVTSSIKRLCEKNHIKNCSNTYELTDAGKNFLKSYYSEPHLDRIRIEILNWKNRKKSKLNCDRIIKSVELF